MVVLILTMISSGCWRVQQFFSDITIEYVMYFYHDIGRRICIQDLMHHCEVKYYWTFGPHRCLYIYIILFF